MMMVLQVNIFSSSLIWIFYTSISDLAGLYFCDVFFGNREKREIKYWVARPAMLLTIEKLVGIIPLNNN